MKPHPRASDRAGWCSVTLGYAGVAALFLGLVSAQASAETRTFEKRLPAVEGGSLIVRSDVGAVRVTGGASGEVTVLATVEGSKAAVEQFEFNARSEGDRIEVTGRTGNRGWSLWRSNDLKVVYTIRVPDRFRLEVNTSGGDVTVRNLAGDVRARTSGGNIGFRDVAGPAEANTSGGDIEIDRSSGPVRARTSGGDIVLTDVAGAAEARTSGGDIRALGIQGEVVTRTSGGSIEVGVAGAHQGVSAETSGGNIDVRVAQDARADVDARTSGGSVRVNLPVTSETEAKHDRFRGQINGGGAAIRVRTSGGSIRIRAAS
jgi:hypothetical protein